DGNTQSQPMCRRGAAHAEARGRSASPERTTQNALRAGAHRAVATQRGRDGARGAMDPDQNDPSNACVRRVGGTPIAPACAMPARRAFALFVLVACGGGVAPEDDPGSGESATGTRCRSDGACLVYDARGGASAQNPVYSPDGSRLVITVWKGG